MFSKFKQATSRVAKNPLVLFLIIGLMIGLLADLPNSKNPATRDETLDNKTVSPAIKSRQPANLTVNRQIVIKVEIKPLIVVEEKVIVSQKDQVLAKEPSAPERVVPKTEPAEKAKNESNSQSKPKPKPTSQKTSQKKVGHRPVKHNCSPVKKSPAASKSFKRNQTTAVVGPNGRSTQVHKCLKKTVESLFVIIKSGFGKNYGAWGFRSYSTQAKLREKNGCPDINISSAATCRIPTARPGYSWHEWGLAIDIYKGKHSPIKSSDPVHKYLERNASKFGLKGLSSESWHYQVKF